MKKESLSHRIVLRYSLFQLPAIIALILILIMLRMLLNIPMWSVWVSIIIWIVKDIILFPFVWRSYDKWNTGPTGSLIGLSGQVIERIAPSGYVKVNGEIWRAELESYSSPVNIGETVEIVSSQGHTLIVKPG